LIGRTSPPVRLSAARSSNQPQNLRKADAGRSGGLFGRARRQGIDEEADGLTGKYWQKDKYIDYLGEQAPDHHSLDGDRQ
jgi:hypothetical protein